MEGRSAAEGLGATSDQGGAGGMREPGGAIRTMVSGGVEEGRSQGQADRLMSRGGVMGLVAGNEVKGSS